MDKIKPRKFKHLAPGQIWCRSVTLLPWEISANYKTRNLYYEIVKKHGGVWELRAILVTKRYDKDEVLTWDKNQTALKPWDIHINGGTIAREFKYITNNRDIFLKNYNILYGSKAISNL